MIIVGLIILLFIQLVLIIGIPIGLYFLFKLFIRKKFILWFLTIVFSLLLYFIIRYKFFFQSVGLACPVGDKKCEWKALGIITPTYIISEIIDEYEYNYDRCIDYYSKVRCGIPEDMCTFKRVFWPKFSCNESKLILN